MSANSSVPPPPPPGTAYIAQIKPQLNFLMISLGLGSPQIPIAIMLFFFSTPQSRRHPMFWLNILVCGLTIAKGMLDIVIDVTNITEPTTIIPTHTYMAQISLTLLLPWICDAVLLVRLLTFFPRISTSNWTYVKVLAFPVIVKTVRFSLLAAYFADTTAKIRDLGSILIVGEATWFRNPFVTSEWMLQVVDNTYLSGFFLLKARAFYNRSRDGTTYRPRSVMQRIKGLLAIALGNFVFPVILNIIQVSFILSDPDFLKGTYVSISNCFITPLGVLFATIWTTGHSWDSEHNPKSDFTSGFAESIGQFRVRNAVRLNATDSYALDTLPSSGNVSIPAAKSWTEGSQSAFERSAKLKEASGTQSVSVNRA